MTVFVCKMWQVSYLGITLETNLYHQLHYGFLINRIFGVRQIPPEILFEVPSD